MAISKKHHYLPQFYLKGFTNDKKEFYIYDKKNDSIRKSNPLNSFFENNRNSANIGGEKSVLLEDIYAHFDDITAPILAKLRNQTIDTYNLSPEILGRIRMFICQLFWRVPRNDTFLSEKIDELSFNQTGFDIINKKTGKSIADKNLQASLKGEEIFRKMYHIFLPFMSFKSEYKKNDYQNWKTYFRADKVQLVGDNPVIVRDFKNFGSLNEELIFPISNDKILVHTQQNKPTNLPPLFNLMTNLLIVQQSNKFVCCSDEEYLTKLIKNLYVHSKDFDFKENMTETIFNFFT